MHIIEDIKDLRKARAALTGCVGFVPTMGCLHHGHQELIKYAHARCDHVIASVFVNPTQFGPGEDYEAYPRDLESDAKKAFESGCSIVFAPTPLAMYPQGHLTSVVVAVMTKNLCGQHRPRHFEGVTTVVSKLFNIVRPDVAVFGQKDYQQLAVLKRMVRDLNLEIDIVGHPIVREHDGLAMSSRNRYLTHEDRVRAGLLSDALVDAWNAWQGGLRDGAALVRLVRARFDGVLRTQIDYVEAIHPKTLVHYTGDAKPIEDEQGCVVALAVHVGQARLLDNLRLDAPLPLILARKNSVQDTSM